MKNKMHIPGRPTTPEPLQLAAIAGSIQHPAVIRTGVTTTQKGKWAVLLVVRKGTPLPIQEAEAKCAGFPVVYQEDSGRMPVARPAFPAAGE